VSDTAAMHGPIGIPEDHPAYAGHFPHLPVLPGAVLLDEALRIIERERRIDLTQWRIASAKFLGVVGPGDVLRLEHDAPHSALIRFTIRSARRTVASGSLAGGSLSGPA
jgi:3-hydroxymyristoyl/3-hydroxydecanoyl-(acyl carrier protein) dehydratase